MAILQEQAVGHRDLRAGVGIVFIEQFCAQTAHGGMKLIGRQPIMQRRGNLGGRFLAGTGIYQAERLCDAKR